MISPRATNLILKHFNAIDKAVAGKLLYKRPRDEEELTKSLIDALDRECQVQEGVSYSIEDLHRDLSAAGDPTYVELSIETHAYSKQWERYVSQADLGLIIQYKNYYEPQRSSSRSWLLQAKRLFPVGGSLTNYKTISKFNSHDKAQHKRIERLIEYVGGDFIRYLLYCPRPENLSDEVRNELSYLRGVAIDNEIFDYTFGLELRDDLMSGSPTIAAGIFVSEIEPFPKEFGDIHRNVFNSTIPFSWFLLEHFTLGGSHFRRRMNGFTDESQNNGFVEGLVRGNTFTIEEIMTSLEDEEFNLRVLPSATITITVSHGNENVRPIRRRE